MNFLFDVIGLITSGIGSAIQAGIRTIFYEICEFVYGIIINLYDVFIALTKAKLLEIDVIEGIAQRVGLILGIVMFFMVSFSFIQMVLDPDKITDKEKGAVNIVKKVLLVIAMFGISPFIFDILQDIETAVIDDGIINRLLLPVGYNVDSDNFGRALSANLFTSFYNIKEGDEVEGDDDYEYCKTDYEQLQTNIVEYGDFSTDCAAAIFTNDLDDGKQRVQFVMNFNYLLCLLVGIFVCYFFIMYTISIGMRVIQLAFLQMISPMAFIAYLSPKKDNMFSKWLKTYVMTFLDAFIRIAIISLGTFLISILMDSWRDINSSANGFGSVFWHSVADSNGTVHSALYIKIIMIMAILSFMKKAPELIKQLIPSTGAAGTLSYGFSAKDRAGLGFGKAVAAGAVGGIAAGGFSALDRYKTNKTLGNSTGKAIKGALGGFAAGAFRGSVAGSGIKLGNTFGNIKTGIANQRAANDKYTDLVTEGGTSMGVLRSKLQSTFGGETPGQLANRRIQNIKALAKFKDSMNAAADDVSFVKSFKTAAESAVQGANERDEDFRKRKDELMNKYRGIRKAFQVAALENKNHIDSIQYTDAQGNDVTLRVNYNISDPDDKAAASKIRTVESQVNEFSESHKVEHVEFDPATGQAIFKAVGKAPEPNIVNGEIVNGNDIRKFISDLSTLADETEAYISGQPGFSARVAEDRAAGVDKTNNKK